MDFNYTGYKGSITVYLALTLTIILSLLFCVIESARISSLKTRSKAISYMAADSAFGEFARPLFEKYGLFGVFSTEEDFLTDIKNYAVKNSSPGNITFNTSFSLLNLKLKDISYNNIYHLTDNDGLFFASQATAYEKYRIIAGKLKEFTGLNDAVTKGSLNTPAYIDENGAYIDNKSLSVLNDMSGSKSSLYKDSSYSSAKSLEENIASKVANLLKSNLLLFFIDDGYTISHTALADETKETLPSHICVLSEEARAIQAGSISDFITAAVDKGLFASYINSSFSSYADTSVNTALSLKYQREYILSGLSADDDNLLSAALSIISLRAAFNLTYLLTDAPKRDAAVNLANSITFYTPFASQLAAFTILSLWSYAEAIIDTRDLFHGQKVPLMKTADTWTLSLEGILTLGKSTESKNDGSSGYTYDEYLNMCLFIMEPFTMYYRCMDLIQLDMCENINPDFHMNSCIVASDIHLLYEAKPLFSSVILLASPDIYTFSVDTLYGYD